VLVTGTYVDVRCALIPSTGNTEETKSACPYNGHARLGTRSGQPQAMPGDSGRFHDCRITWIQPGWQRNHPLRWDEILLGHPPIDTDAERALRVRGAKVVPALRALLTSTTSVHGLDDNRGSVRTDACDLMTEDLL
jgi:hypothetical protein